MEKNFNQFNGDFSKLREEFEKYEEQDVVVKIRDFFNNNFRELNFIKQTVYDDQFYLNFYNWINKFSN